MTPYRHLFLPLLLTGTTLLGACTWVGTSPESEQVVVLPADRVGQCQRIGVISTSVKAAILGVGRNANKVRDELDNLARQQAVIMEANTVVRESIINGKGSYVAYRCP